MTSIFPSLHEIMMRHALVIARQNPSHPFGSVIVDASGEVIAEGINRSAENPTWHSEIDAINECSEIDDGQNWSNYILYTTAEPCSMCMSAILWSGIGAVVYGSSIKSLQTMGWKQIDLSSNEVIAKSWDREMTTMGGVLEEECDQFYRKAVQKLKAS